MKYRRFGRTEMRLSQIILGCMQFTGEKPEVDAIQVVEDAVAAGINHIETDSATGAGSEGGCLHQVRRLPAPVPGGAGDSGTALEYTPAIGNRGGEAA